MPKKFDPAPFRERMGFAQTVDTQEGFHELAPSAFSSGERILEQGNSPETPLKGAKVDFLAKRTGPIGAVLSKKSHENYFIGCTAEQKITLGSQITVLDKSAPIGPVRFHAVQGPNLASLSPDATNVKVQRVKSSAFALERTSREFNAEQPTETLEPPPLPKTRALSTKSVTQLKAADERRTFFARERAAQAIPTQLSHELAAKVATDLLSRVQSPLSAEDVEQQARFNQMSLFLEPKMVAELDVPFHWWRAVKLLEPIRSSLGTAYRPMLVIVSLASSVGRSVEDLERMSQTLGAVPPSSLEPRDSVFFAALWEVAVVTGITPDYLRKVLAFHSDKLRCLMHHHDWKTETSFQGKKQVLIAGCLFRLRWPPEGLEQYSPELFRGGKTKTVYKALINRKSVYRDLDADVFEGHTEQSYRNEGKVSSNPLGTVKNVTRSSELPQGFALELLTYCMGRIKGLTGYTVSDIQRYGSQIERINALVNLLESPVLRGHNKLENRVRAVADLLCGTLEEGSECHVKGWLHVCWTLYRTGKVVWLLQAVWDVLVRASDLGSIRSKGAMVRAMLNKRGFLELREALEEQRAA